MSDAVAVDRPTVGLAVTFGDRYRIVTHPAFRIGFLDAQAGRDFDHDTILERIAAETPPRALVALGFGWAADKAIDEQFELFGTPEQKTEYRETRGRAVVLAQYRYEEGRRAVLEFGLTCRAWGHPDFPPASVMRYCEGVALMG